jgi:hypothetical protein
MLRIPLALSPAVLLLTGCLSFSSTEAPAPPVTCDCQGREQQCRDTCGSAGVQSFSCTAKPGAGFDYRCECRSKGTAL